MNRRRLLARAGALALASPILAGRPRAIAQTSRPARRIGVLSWYSRGARADEFFESYLAELGLVEGEHYSIDYRYAGGNRQVAVDHAAAFAADRVDLIVAVATPAALVVKATTRTIPVVFQSADPLQSGLVTSLSRPEANLTGISTVSTDISGLRLQILRDIVPNLSSAAFLGSRLDPNGAVFARQITEAGASLKIDVSAFLVDGPEDFARTFRTIAAEGHRAVLFQPLFLEHRVALAALALEGRLASAADQREFAEAGALLSYGTNRKAFQRRMAAMIAKVLDGAKAGDLPIEQPTVFELVLNQKTAGALGLTIPPTVLLRANEVIE